MTHEPNSPEERRILSDLLDELESVRVGRSVRRKATAGIAVLALLVTVVVLSLPSPTTPVVPGPIAISPDPQPAIEDLAVPAPIEPALSGRIEIVESVAEFAHVEIAEDAPMRHIEYITDRELIRVLRETNTSAGLATFGGRTVLTSNPSAPTEAPAGEPSTF
ncbi:MAG: hypothetical protein RLN60_03060 [Phycisphaerales bacterium]